jgi:hypothetical protein
MVLVIAITQRVICSRFRKSKDRGYTMVSDFAKTGFRFLRTDPLLDPKSCYTIIATSLLVLYHNLAWSLHIEWRKKSKSVASRRNSIYIVGDRRA